jgi:hypothetical protein
MNCREKLLLVLHQTLSNHFFPVPIGERSGVQDFVICSVDGPSLLFMSLLSWILCMAQHV